MALHYAICRPVRKLTNTNILIISAGTTATPAYSGMTRQLAMVRICTCTTFLLDGLASRCDTITPYRQIPPITAIKGKFNNILGDIEEEP